MILEGPMNATAASGDWARFSCSTPCSDTLNAWYVEGYPHPIIDPETDSLPGMEVQRTIISRCEDGDPEYMEVLDVRAAESLDGAAVQCSSINHMCDEDGECSYTTFYSRFALLSTYWHLLINYHETGRPVGALYFWDPGSRDTVNVTCTCRN